MPPRKAEIGAAQSFICDERIRPTIVPGELENFAELFEAASSNIAQELLAVSVVPIRGGRADASQACSVGESETAGPLVDDEVQRSFDECFTQIAVVVTSAPP